MVPMVLKTSQDIAAHRKTHSEHNFVTILHQRSGGSSVSYKHVVALLASVPVTCRNAIISLPLHCVSLLTPDPLIPTGGTFKFAMGLLPMTRAPHSETHQVWDFAVSYGQGDATGSVQRFSVSSREDNATVDNATVDSRAMDNFYVLWMGRPSSNVLHQAHLMIDSLLAFQTNAFVWFYTDESAHSQIQTSFSFYSAVKVLLLNWAQHVRESPVEGIRDLPAGPPQRADLFRLVSLWRWGGSYIDLDDIVVRPLPSEWNIMPYLELPNQTVSGAWGTKIKLIDGRWKTLVDPVRDMRWAFHFQNDPMLNFEPHHPFIGDWLRHISKLDAKQTAGDWGQRLPTEMFQSDPGRYSPTLHMMPQHYLLLHPAFAPDGGRFKKGPMFPPYDFRLPAGFPDYDTKMDYSSFRSNWAILLKAHSYRLVKHSKFRGFAQAGVFQDLCGWLSKTDVAELAESAPCMEQ